MSDTQNMEQAQEVQHAAMVKNAVKKKRITAEEYTEITGKEYQ